MPPELTTLVCRGTSKPSCDAGWQNAQNCRRSINGPTAVEHDSSICCRFAQQKMLSSGDVELGAPEPTNQKTAAPLTLADAILGMKGVDGSLENGLPVARCPPWAGSLFRPPFSAMQQIFFPSMRRRSCFPIAGLPGPTLLVLPNHPSQEARVVDYH